MQRGLSLKRVTASPTNHPSFFEHLQACATKHRHSLLIVTFLPSNNQTDPQTVCASATPEGSVGNSCSVTCQRRTSPVVQITCELRQSFDTGTQAHLDAIAGLHTWSQEFLVQKGRDSCETSIRPFPAGKIQEQKRISPATCRRLCIPPTIIRTKTAPTQHIAVSVWRRTRNQVCCAAH